MRAVMFLSACAPLFLLAPRAEAAAASRLVYARDPSALACPDESALRENVRKRLGWDPFFGVAKQTIVVQVTRSGAKFVAHVQLVDDVGTSRGARDIVSETEGCDELIDSVALAVTIALEALSDPSPATLPPSAPRPNANAEQEGEPASELAIDAPTTPPPLQATAARRNGFAGIGALASAGLAPFVQGGVLGYGGVRFGIASIAAELRADGGGSQIVVGGRVTSSLFAGALVPCVHVGVVFACIATYIGRFSATSEGVTSPRSDASLLFALGPRAGVEVPLGGAFALRLHGELLANLERAHLLLDGVAVWIAPAIAPSGGAGIAVHFR